MKDSIYDLLKYKDVNKSTIFLYALLQVKNKDIEPAGTYMGIEGCSIHGDMNLICLFHGEQEGFELIDRELRTQKQFSFCRDDTDGFRYYVMDFSRMYAIYKSIEDGRYSELSKNAKTIIMFTDHPVGLMGVSPESYYQEFSIDLRFQLNSFKTRVN